MMTRKISACKGFSLIEMLVVISIFAVVGLLSTRAILLTLKGSKKSEANVKVRENLDYSLGVIERNLRNAQSISSTDCSNAGDEIQYTDQAGTLTKFSCVFFTVFNPRSSMGYVASGSASTFLTSPDVNVTSCTFSCTPGAGGIPTSVDISISAKEATGTGVDASATSVNTKIFLRN